MESMMPLRTYRSHKVVLAAKIATFGESSITTEDGDEMQLPQYMIDKGRQGGDPGYIVRYEDGYTSWSPAKAFEEGYVEVTSTGMTFGDAIRLLKQGRAVQRAGWNGKGMFVVMMPELKLPPFDTQGTDRKVNDRTAKWIGTDQPLNCRPYTAMYNAKREWQPGWVCSQEDMYAEDWQEFQPG